MTEFGRRAFLKGGTSSVIVASMLPHLALAASGAGGVMDGRVLVNTCIGPMRLIKEGGKVVGVEALPQVGEPWVLIDSMPDRLYNRARVRAPAVRRDFLEKREASDRTGRGSGDFVEVSWDEALNLVAEELERVKTTYGNASLHRGKSSWASNHAHFYKTESLLQRFLNQYGGCAEFFGNYSNQAISEIMPTVAWGATVASDWPVVRDNAKLVVIWGANPAVTTRILSGRYMTAAWLGLKESPIEVIVIDPVRSETAQSLDARWVPVRPNTDTALALGMMHTLYTENLHDAAFLEDYTYGFDTFLPYLTGEQDGQPKSAEWAAEITGVPADTIRELVRKMQGTRTQIVSGWSIQRQHHGEQGPWALAAFAAMLGQIGLPGGGINFGMNYGDIGFPRADMPSVGGTPRGSNAIPDPFPIACLTDAYLNPGKVIQCKGRDITYPDIRLVYTSGGNQFTHHQDTNLVVKAFQAPETIIVQDPWWTPSAKFADIVLPAASDLERNDLGQVINLILGSHAAVDPQFQSRTDYDILSDLADRLGFGSDYTEGKSEMDWVRMLYDEARGMSKTVEMPDFDTFWEGESLIEFPMGKGDVVQLADFREDPLLNPLGTATGLFEFVSPTVAKMGYDEDCPAHPTWLEPVEWRGSAQADTYPLQMVSAHSMYRLHSQMCNTDARKHYAVSDREPVTINSEDAAARGIQSGDIVRIFNDRGQVLAGAVVTDGIMPGTICLHEGAWYDPVQGGTLGSLDKYGSPNVLTREEPRTSRFAQATIAGTAIVQVEKYEEPAPAVTAFDPAV
ncbi:molybdopterin-dependent oxidoreductase [Tropicimonas sp. IMCC6043]|uniref:molybdopterin-dependent oxidoreductase n=1 Tax=Tropicimonas sp. IMCC6043 TaxID=2510645 RepID=UPI0013EBE85B|nr:molybdopterin-dependent oxidoreductase [Tropicimonas sp. IMCC6043]